MLTSAIETLFHGSVIIHSLPLHPLSPPSSPPPLPSITKKRFYILPPKGWRLALNFQFSWPYLTFLHSPPLPSNALRVLSGAQWPSEPASSNFGVLTWLWRHLFAPPENAVRAPPCGTTEIQQQLKNVFFPLVFWSRKCKPTQTKLSLIELLTSNYVGNGLSINFMHRSYTARHWSKYKSIIIL